MLPPETPAKMLLGINIFVAFFLLMVLLKDSTPPTAKQIPIIGAYYCFNMVMTTISTFLCSILVDMHYRADKRNPPSRWLTFVSLKLFNNKFFYDSLLDVILVDHPSGNQSNVYACTRYNDTIEKLAKAGEEN